MANIFVFTIVRLLLIKIYYLTDMLAKKCLYSLFFMHISADGKFVISGQIEMAKRLRHNREGLVIDNFLNLLPTHYLKCAALDVDKALCIEM